MYQKVKKKGNREKQMRVCF